MKVLQILVLIIVLVVSATAQKTVLTGTIYDDQGAVVTATLISAKDESGKVYTATTNSAGIYSIELSEGIYNLEFKARYFKRFKLKNYRVVKAYQNKMYFDAALKPLAVDLF